MKNSDSDFNFDSHSDDAIEKIFAGLRDSEPSPGMERRILDAIADHASAAPPSGWHRLQSIWLLAPGRPAAMRSVAYTAALAAGIATVVAILAIHHPDASPIHNGSIAASHPASTHPHVVVSNAPSTRSASNAKPVAAYPRPTRARERAAVQHVNSPRDGDSDALREMHAASYPAPPIPLTEQERLLLKIAHRGDPEELAMLNPQLRSKQIEDGKTEFQKFFDPAKTANRE